MTEGSIVKALTIGSSKAALRAEPNSPLSQLLTLQVNEIVKRIRDNIYKYDIDATNNLAVNIIPTPAVTKDNEITVEIEAPFYGKFVNYGVNGSLVNRGAPNWGSQPQSSFSMSQSLSQWESRRGIKYVNGVYNWTSKSKVEGMTMQERGQKPRPFYSDVVNDALIRELSEPISILMGRAIEIKITEPWQ